MAIGLRDARKHPVRGVWIAADAGCCREGGRVVWPRSALAPLLQRRRRRDATVRFALVRQPVGSTSGRPTRSSIPAEVTMLDVVFLLTTAAFFALSIAYASGCDKL